MICWQGIVQGAKTILVKTGAGMDSLGKDRDKWSNIEPNYISEDILDAVLWLLAPK